MTDHCHSSNVDDVYSAIRSLSVNKAESVDDLYSDNFKHATDLLIRYITLIINCMISHGSVPDSFLKANGVPIPKNRRVDLTDSNNYRTIAMSSIFKIKYLIIINKQSTQLKTSDYQFGSKKHSSTIICTTALTEIIKYYVDNGSSVFVLLIDASKAFDRVSHSTLFKILREHNICPNVLRLLYNMASHSEMQVRWKDNLSIPFALNNGVKQGGVLSPILFTLYINGFLERLKSSGLGCHIGRMFAGAYGFAGDIAIATPSIYCMRQMILICEQYAKEYEIMLNPIKSKLLCYNLISDFIPSVKLCGQCIEVVSDKIYLGNHIYNDIYSKNISEFVGDFYRRSNHIISNFNMCDIIKLNHLHVTYSTSMYGCELLQHNVKYMSQLYVAWRKSIRRVFRLPSQTYNYIVSNLGGCIVECQDRRLTKYIYNILHGDNNVIKTIVHSKLYMSPKSIIAENYKYIS